jgi:DNA mismatch endonuclease Vsr
MDLSVLLRDNKKMADVLTVSQRSYNMSQIRSRGTAPEKDLGTVLRNGGLRHFSTHPAITGKPDIYFSREKLAVFMDGCFWHACSRCFRMPASNRKFWRDKIGKNILRDKKVNKELAAQGIQTVRIWEHELKDDPKKILRHVQQKLSMTTAPKILDLFAGAGGFSEGFVRAGCEIVGHIEMDKDACSTLATRMMYHALLKKGKLQEYRNYISGKITRDALIKKYGLQREENSVICSKIEEGNYKKLIRQIKERLGGGRLDVIVGGPPCQAYSHIGRSVDVKNMKWDRAGFWKSKEMAIRGLRVCVITRIISLRSASETGRL